MRALQFVEFGSVSKLRLIEPPDPKPDAKTAIVKVAAGSDVRNVESKMVYGTGEFTSLDETAPPPAMPDWSPARRFGGYAAWGDYSGSGQAVARRSLADACGCANHCGIHGHDHATARSARLPVSDLRSFWGTLGCSCWAF